MANYNKFNSTSSTFRDKDESKMTDDRFSKIENKISDNIEANELVAETVENKGNQISNNINETNKINLNIEKSASSSADDLKSVHSVSSTISNKISTFTAIMKEKLDIKKGNAQPSERLQQSTEKTLSDLLPLPVEDAPLTEVVKGIVKTPKPDEKPEDKFYPPEEKKRKKEDGKGKKGKNDDEILKTLKGGFNKSLSVSNRIAAFLFTISVTAVASLAAIGASLFSIILAMDVIRIHIKYWMGLLNSNFEEFDKKMGKLAPYFETIATGVSDIFGFFKSGEYAKGILRFGEMLLDVGKLIIDGIIYGMSKLLASVVRAFGFDEKADDIEAVALINYSLSTGYTPTEEELTKIGNYKAKNALDAEQINKNDALDFYNSTDADRWGSTPEYSEGSLHNKILAEEAKNDNLSKEDMSKSFGNEHLMKVEYDKISRRIEEHRDEPERIAELESQLKDLKAKSDSVKMPKTMRDNLEQEYNIVANQIYNAKNNSEEVIVEQAEDLRAQEQIQNINNMSNESNTSNVNNENNTNVVNQNNVRNTNIITNDVKTNIPRAGMQSAATMAGAMLR